MSAPDRPSEQDISLMEEAIALADKCTVLRPDDPKVGAILLSADGEIERAFRGELAAGEHAEFTLIHRKVRSKALTDGATLYSTLEPCTARSHDKRPCADWIISAGVRRVFIGVLDPNRNIRGEGYWRLVEAGVEVGFFPPTLAKRILRILAPFIKAHREPPTFDSTFASFVATHKGSTVSPYTQLGWGDVLELQNHPDRREGWPVSQIEISNDDNSPFTVPRTYQESYDRYFQDNYVRRRFSDDGEKFMLARNPTAFEDSRSLTLATRPTRFSVQQYYRDCVATVAATREALIRDVASGSLNVNFAHCCSLQMVVITRDRKILITQRSAKVARFPGVWSCSVEEDLSRLDLAAKPMSPMVSWTHRLFKEELGVTPDGYRLENVRVASVFLETDHLNLSLCAHGELELDADTLSDVIRGHPRTDYEFSEFGFLDLEKRVLLRELRQPSRPWHPTSMYRLLLTLLRYYPAPRAAELQ